MATLTGKQIGRLWLIRDGSSHPVGVDEKGYVRVLSRDAEGEDFTITQLSHPSLDGGIAYELRSAAGWQITGGGKKVLREAAEEIPVPGPAYRVIAADIEYPDRPNLLKIQLRTLDSRHISANTIVATSSTGKVDGFSWGALHPDIVKNYDVTPSTYLQLLEPHQAPASEFWLQLKAPDVEA